MSVSSRRVSPATEPRRPRGPGATSRPPTLADRARVASAGQDRCATRWPRSPKRIALAIAGIVCVGLAFVGAALPGLPTTVFLIAASYLFARSCPWLEDRLIHVRWFRPYLPYLDGSRPMPRRARWVAIAAMWIGVSASVFMTAVAGRFSLWFASAVVSAAAIGTVVILRIRRSPAPASVQAGETR